MPRRLALVGLSPLDRALLEAIFLHNLQGGVSYALVNTLDQADLIISNADDTHAVRELQTCNLQAPVLLIGDADAGTGWPVLSRPLQLHAVLAAVNQLTFRPRAAALHRPAPPHRPATQGREASHASPIAFVATEPFAPLERNGGTGASTSTGFEATQPFGWSASASSPSRRPSAARPGLGDPINAQSVLMWRGAQAVPSAVSVDAPAQPLPPGAQQVPEAPAMAGFEPTRDAMAPERVMVPSHWRELARHQALERHAAPQAQGTEDETPSSSFADPAEGLTTQQRLPLPGSMRPILLVTRPRSREGSLQKALRDFGHPVDCVPDGAAAVKHLGQQDYCLVFLDDRSLGGETLAVCRAVRQRLRALGQRPQVVVVARGGLWLRRLWARLAGCDHWMITPLRKSTLRTYLLENGSDPAA